MNHSELMPMADRATEPSPTVSRESQFGREIRWRLDAAGPTNERPLGAETNVAFHPAQLLETAAVDGVDLVYDAEPSAAECFALYLSVSLAGRGDQGSDERMAAEASLQRRFAAVGQYARFTETQAGADRSLQCRVTLRPPSFVVTTRGHRTPAGFVQKQRRGALVRVVASAPVAERGAVNTFARMARHLPGAVQLRLAYRRRVLASAEVAALSEAVEQLSRRGQVERPTGDGEWQSATTPQAIEAARLSLTRWLIRPTGYRVTCEIYADALLSGTSARDVGTELFPGWELAVVPSGAESVMVEPYADCVDLGDCLNDLDPLPAWLPDAPSLRHTRVPRHYPAPDDELPRRGIVLGQVDGQTVHLGDEDRLRHLYVCGATGTGKSTLLYNMAVQDIESGRGVCVVDPHGDLHAALLRSIPEGRVNDVVVIDPTIEEWSVGLNFLECTGTSRRMQIGYIVNEALKIFESLYDMRLVGGPMFEQYMRNALLLLLQADGYDEATLVDVNRVFEDREFRHSLLKHCSDPIVVGFWTRQAERAGGEATLTNMAPYVTSKLNQFVTNPLLRPLIGQPRSTIDLREVIDSGRILLVNLARGRLGRLDSHLLGMLVLGRLFLAALSRADVDVTSRRPFNLYVDEFQNVITETTAQALAESRKYGLCLTLANQTLSQLEGPAGKLLEAVLGNCGSFAFFRLGVPDAERLERYTRPELSALDLQELPDFHVAARLLVGGRPLRSFVFNADAPRPVTRSAAPELVLATALQHYARRVDDIEADIRRRWAADPFASGTTTEPDPTRGID